MTLNELFANRIRWMALMIIVFVVGGAWTLSSRVPSASTTNGNPPLTPSRDVSLQLSGQGWVTFTLTTDPFPPLPTGLVVLTLEASNSTGYR